MQVIKDRVSVTDLEDWQAQGCIIVPRWGHLPSPHLPPGVHLPSYGLLRKDQGGNVPYATDKDAFVAYILYRLRKPHERLINWNLARIHEWLYGLGTPTIYVYFPQMVTT
jgi:hypothetical protein